jgi:hypothetical protein
MNETKEIKKRGRPLKIRPDEKVKEKTQEPKAIEPSADAPERVEIVADVPEKAKNDFREKAELTIAERIAESRKSLSTTLPPTQIFFETPEGEIIIAEADRDRVWSRTMNNGKGGWCNPRR